MMFILVRVLSACTHALSHIAAMNTSTEARDLQ